MRLAVSLLIAMAAGALGFVLGLAVRDAPASPDQAAPASPDQAAPASPDQTAPASPDQAAPESPDAAGPAKTTSTRRARERVAPPPRVRTREAELRAARDDMQDRLLEIDAEITRLVADHVPSADEVESMLRALSRGRLPQFDLVRDVSRFSALFARETDGPTVNGDTLSPYADIADGTTIRFGAGVHTWRNGKLKSLKNFPKDLVVEGAGRETTLLLLQESVETSATIRSLTLRDMTIHCNDDAFIDLGSTNPASIHLQRCRVIGFDAGHGGDGFLRGGGGIAFHAEDSLIAAGFERRPSSCELFSVNTGLLARFDRCTFEGHFRRPHLLGRGNRHAYVFSDCRFDRVSPAWRETIEKPPANAHFEECTATYLPQNADRVERLVSEINGLWVLPR